MTKDPPHLAKVDKREPHKWPKRWCHWGKVAATEAEDDDGEMLVSM
jgi:hypothetical protein